MDGFLQRFKSNLSRVGTLGVECSNNLRDGFFQKTKTLRRPTTLSVFTQL